MWITPGSIEIEGRTLNGDAPITAEMWREVARSYDPDFREASVIAAPDGADKSAHVSGKYAPRLGKIRAVKFDGVFGWVDFEPTKVYRTIVEKNGGMFPSVGLRIAPDLAGSPWYLDHVAALGGETPATPNLDRFRSLRDDGQPEGSSVYRSQTTKSKEIAVAEESTKATAAAADEPDTKKGDQNAPEPNAETATEPAAESRSADEIAQKAAESVFRAMGLEPRKAEAEKPAAGADAQVLRAVTELTETVKKQGEELQKMRAAAEKREKEAKTTEVRRSLDSLVGRGIVRAADVDKVADGLADLNDEARAAVLRSMEMSQGVDLGEEVTIETDDGSVVQIDDHRYRTGEGPSGVDRSTKEGIAKARAAATKDGKLDQNEFNRRLRDLKAKQIRRQGVA